LAKAPDKGVLEGEQRAESRRNQQHGIFSTTMARTTRLSARSAPLILLAFIVLLALVAADVLESVATGKALLFSLFPTRYEKHDAFLTRRQKNDKVWTAWETTRSTTGALLSRRT